MLVLSVGAAAHGEALVQGDHPLGRRAAQRGRPAGPRRPQAALELLLAVIVLQPGRGQVALGPQDEVTLVPVLLLPQVPALDRKSVV